MLEAVLDPALVPIIPRKLSEFLQLHWMTSYPASLPNRGRDGEPKTIVYGNVERLRISSQCLKRTCRCGLLFKRAFGDLGDDYLSLRTKEMGAIVYDRLLAGGVDKAAAEQWTLVLAAVFGPTKPKNPKKKDTFDHLKNETMFLVSPREKKALLAYVDRIIAEKLVPPAVKGKEEMEKEAKKLRPQILLRTDSAVDRAIFGRMFAQDKLYSVEASLQVAHAMSVHSADVVDDAFAAVDDVKESDEEGDNGSGHLGEVALGAGVFYNYASINLPGLRANLDDQELVVPAVTTLIESLLTEFPRAKGPSCAQGSRAFYGRLEYGQKTPRNLALAFLDPVDGKGVGPRAVKRIMETSADMDKIYGPCFERMAEFNVLEGKGSLAELLDLARRAAEGTL
jgi:CRISPR system Cascade subunit CasC